MSLLIKIIGNFRWLFLLVGIAVATVVAWVFWPADTQPRVVTTEKIVSVTDSVAIRQLRDSLALMRRSQISVKIRRVTVHDTLGNLTTTLDSMAAQSDTLYLTKVHRDTTYVHVRDTLQIVRSNSSGHVKRGYLLLETYTDKSLDPGFTAAVKVPVGEFFSVNGYADYQDLEITARNLELGGGVGMDWSIISVSGLVKNEGISGNGFDFEVRGGVIVRF